MSLPKQLSTSDSPPDSQDGETARKFEIEIAEKLQKPVDFERHSLETAVQITDEQLEPKATETKKLELTIEEKS